MSPKRITLGNLARGLQKFGKKEHLGQVALAHMLGSDTMSGQGLYIGRGGLHSGKGMYTGPGMYTGAGEYVAGNDLIASSDACAGCTSKSSMDIVPEFSKASDDGVILTRREYVSEIYGPPLTVPKANPAAVPPIVSTACSPFVVQSFPLNPGLEGTFPWLSQIAENYDEYELLQCIFTFKSTTSESSNTANGQVGTVLMATSYNAAQPNFTDKVSMMQYEFSNSGRITESLLHGVECDPAKLSGSRGEYIRNNPVVVGQDLKTYDHGKFQIAIANCAATYANQSLGELWVSYTVKLRKAKFYTALGFGISKDIFVSNGGERLDFVLGTNILNGQQNNIGCRITQTQNPAAGSTCGINITFPASYKGNVKIQLNISSGILAAVLTNYATISYLGDVTTGNVNPIVDQYGNNANGGSIDDTPSKGVFATNVAQGMVLILHYSVDIATSGIDNTLQIQVNLTSAGCVPSQTYLEISEYNAGFSYAATGLAPASATNAQQPVFINSSGVVTVPN